jgi:nickel superoxide dismutase
MRIGLTFALTVVSLAFSARLASAHCQIPCGIYGDEQRIEMISEHITTIEKSMNEIAALTQNGDVNYNQLVRWVMNKEAHAEYIQDIVFQYFMSQRVKPVEPNDRDAYDAYVAQLTTLHQIAVQAMKAKQTTDLQHVEALRELLASFKTAYSGEAVPAHDRKHSH